MFSLLWNDWWTMKKTFITLFVSCAMSSCAHIVQMDDMQNIFETFKEADSKTLVIFDVDMVLVQPSDPAFQMANMKRFSTVAKRIMSEVPADKQMMFLALMTISSDPILIDGRVPQWFEQMVQRGIPAMALTSNLTGKLGNIPKMEEWRVQSLRNLEIDFSKTAPCLTTLMFDDLASYRGYYSTYLNGILFVNGTTVSKGDAFLSFLRRSGFVPNKVIFIDDKEDNLKSLEAAVQLLDRPVDYLGVHYLGAQKYPSIIISEVEFESRWKGLASQVKEMD